VVDNVSLEAELNVDPNEREQEIARLADERYAAHYEPQRSWAAMAAFCALCAVFWLVSLIPAVQARLGIEPWELAGLMLVEALAIAAATVSARRFGGVLGRAHRVTERVETAVTAAVLNALIYGSGSAVSIFWLFSVLHLAHGTPDSHNTRFNRACHALCLVPLALGFAVGGKLADSVIVAFFGALVQLLSWAQARSAEGSVAAQAERNVLRRRLEHVLVEHERKRIARDLHDGLGGQLAALAWAAEALVAEQPHASAELALIAERARSGLHELRWLVSDLKQASMTLEQLAALLRSGGARIAPRNIAYSVEPQGDTVLPPDLCYQLNLMVREATLNAFRHAYATRVTVRLVHDDDGQLLVEVRDDGRGLPPQARARSGGGLAHLQERADKLGAEFVIDSSDSGTRVAIRLATLGGKVQGSAGL
jgi:signal transduction histidine kinase